MGTMSEIKRRRIAALGIGWVLALAFIPALTSRAEIDAWAGQRAAMVEEVRNYARLALGVTEAPLDERVLEVLGKVHRHEFVGFAQRLNAYDNRPLPIGHGQTISQPYIVALMTDLVEPDPDDVVLEVGTGSGYQAAVLAELVSQVYSIEIVPALYEQAAKRLAKLGYDNVSTRLGDGYYGWEEHGPYDAIIVTAAASHVPPPLVRQLKVGGLMMIPVGDPFTVQRLVLVEKSDAGEILSRTISTVRFVPLTGDH
jgi:protein-L-isoaspartate(D-aspartate) O-methyltransferase